MADAGFTVIESTAAGVTVSGVDPLTAPRVALIVVVPAATEVASALELTVASAVFPESQVAEAVRSCMLPSVNVPVAVNCCVVPRAIDGLEGLTAIETSEATPTVRVVEAEIEPEVAEMLEFPVATLVASPTLPLALLMVAIDVFDESHWTEPVMFWALPSVKVPVAANCSVVPSGMPGIAGVTAIETNAAEVIVKVDVPAMVAAVAVIVVWPVDALAANPLVLTVATEVDEELQVTEVVKSSVLPSA